MRKVFLSLILGVSLTSFASAKTPPEVLTPYKAYRTAIKAKDYKTASEEAFKAWQKAEELLGDHATTGNLAQNYANLGLRADLKYKPVRQAFLRSFELVEDPLTRLEYEASFAIFASRKGKHGDFKDRFEEIVKFANDNGLGQSTFLGEIYTMRAEIANRRRQKKKLAEYSQKALEIFENSNDGISTVSPWMAQLYSGYANEYEEDLIPALMNYQAVMENTESALPQDHPFVMKALGRWMLMRNRVNREGLKSEAESAGMCECWPYDVERNETVQPVKRYPGKMPRDAYVSGYAIVEFDLADDGSVVKPRILTSWPQELYEEPSLKAVKRWKYSAKQPQETESDRKDILVTMRYMLTDQFGNVVE